VSASLYNASAHQAAAAAHFPTISEPVRHCHDGDRGEAGDPNEPEKAHDQASAQAGLQDRSAPGSKTRGSRKH
jgi:hypothetical protein